MNKNNFIWRCICCEKEIPLVFPEDTNLNNDWCGSLPNMEGGTIEIHFGYGSEFDMLPDHMFGRDVRIQSAICDSCFEVKKHLTRKIEVINQIQYKEINNDKSK